MLEWAEILWGADLKIVNTVKAADRDLVLRNATGHNKV